MTERDFQKLVLDAVDDAFSSLGDSAKQSIYFHLENRFMIKRDEIPNRLEDFEGGIERIFGAGARFLQILIMKKLHERVEPKKKVLKWDEEKEFNLAEYVRAARKSFSKAKKKS